MSSEVKLPSWNPFGASFTFAELIPVAYCPMAQKYEIEFQ